ncbi:MAG: T9SS type A sorting domain-containing protein [Bacteroidota bacterium]
MKTLLLSFLLCVVSISAFAFSTRYYPNAVTAPAGSTTTYCVGATNVTYNANITMCPFTSSVIGVGNDVTEEWYFNGSLIYTNTTTPFSTAGYTATLPAGSFSMPTVGTFSGATGLRVRLVSSTAPVGGCAASPLTGPSTTIIVGALPSAIAGLSTVCTGSTITLTNTTTGGAWSSSATGIASVGAATGIVTGVTAGVATITYATSASCFVTKAVTVNTTPLGGTITGTAALCEGATTTLANATATPGGAWTSSTPAVGTVGVSGIVAGIASGTTTISYTVTTACGTSIATRVVTVNTSPAAIIPAAPRVCIGSSTALTSPPGGGTWASASTATASIVAATGIVTGNAVGTVAISYSNGCGTAVGALLTVDPLPNAITGPGNLCGAGNTITLSNTTVGGTWSTASTNIAAATISSTEGLITGFTTGTATVTYTSVYGCRITRVITVDPTPGPIGGTKRHCVGTTTTMTNALPGGVWSSSTPMVATIDPATGVVTGLIGGTTTISYTNACATLTAIDTVVATPPSFVGRDSVCLGDTLVLASSATGGTWTSSTTSVATVLSSSGVVSGLSLGTSTITYTIPPGCARTKQIRVIGLPPAITGTAQVCPGRTTVLSNASAGGTWSSVDPGIATVGATSGVVTGVAASTGTIVYTDSRGCRASTVVTVNPLPEPIIGENRLCATVGDTLYSPTPGGLWSSLTPTIATIGATNGALTTVSGGTAVIRYTLTATGCYISKQITVNPAPAPLVTFNFNTATFFAPEGYASYQWYDSLQGLITGAITRTTAAKYDGYYYVVVVDSLGCVGRSANIPYYLTMVGVSGFSAEQFRIFPNPANNVLYIQSPVAVKAVITDMAGRAEVEQENAREIDITNLVPGLHTISLYDDKGNRLTVQKIVKQ